MKQESIPAHKLDDELVLEVGDVSINYNPLGYAYRVLNGGSHKETVTVTVLWVMYDGREVDNQLMSHTKI